MRLVMVRHAIAAQREDFRGESDNDDLRPLTAEGRVKMKIGARGLKHVIPEVDLWVTSPLVRARETLDLIKPQYGKAKIAVEEALRPQTSTHQFVEWLRRLEVGGGSTGEEVVGVVGHEPRIGEWASFLLTGKSGSFFDVGKGSVIVLNWSGRLIPGKVWLECLIQPSQLRAIGSAQGDGSPPR